MLGMGCLRRVDEWVPGGIWVSASSLVVALYRFDVSSSGGDGGWLSRECRMLAKFDIDGNQHRGVSLFPYYAKRHGSDYAKRHGSAIGPTANQQTGSAGLADDAEHAELPGNFLVAAARSTIAVGRH